MERNLKWQQHTKCEWQNRYSNTIVLTTDIPEGTNKYYTDGLARSAISATSPLSYNKDTVALSILQATAANDGYLKSSDWTTMVKLLQLLLQLVQATIPKMDFLQLRMPHLGK